MAESKIRRCAIYTRKSSEEGLEQKFNSLHAQREACESFVRSQRGEGWRLLNDVYDDGGISGGTMDRPALKQLMVDIEAGQIDTVVVYKVDRLTRSLSDFSKMVEVFDRKSVSFVAVTQQFNTTSSMGRLTLNILLSFAQFEREVTGERIRDKVAASKRKGMWMGGGLPRGYRVEDRKLVVVPEQAEVVKTIFRTYLESSGVRDLSIRLSVMGITATSRSGKQGISIGRGALHVILRNPIYRGLVPHKGKCYPGQHVSIVDQDLWDAVQAKLDAGVNGKAVFYRKTDISLLMGKLFDEQGRPLTPSHATKQGRRYRYYQTHEDDRDQDSLGKANSQRWSLPAKQIEKCVGEIVSTAAWKPAHIGAEAIAAGSSIEEVDSLLSTIRQASLSERLAWVNQVHLAPHQVTVSFSIPAKQPIRIEETVSVDLRRRGRGRRIVIAGSTEKAGTPDQRMIKALGTGQRYWEQLQSEQPLSGRDFAKQEGVDHRYIGRTLQLAFLAPDVIEAIVGGHHPVELTAERLIWLQELPLSWVEQRQLLLGAA